MKILTKLRKLEEKIPRLKGKKREEAMKSYRELLLSVVDEPIYFVRSWHRLTSSLFFLRAGTYIRFWNISSGGISILYVNIHDIFRGLRVMSQNKRSFPIEKKLAAIEWNLKLLKTSAEITHTPLQTLKSMIQVSVVSPTQNFLQEIADSHLR